MPTIYHDADADLSVLHDRTLGIIGYGNQGRAQALNLRDNSCSVVVGCPADDYATQAAEDGFEVLEVAQAVETADVIFVLIPDEVQPEVYRDQIAPCLRDGNVLCFASGYNVFYKLVAPPPTVDVVMVAPRMIGDAVRSLFVSGKGFPCLVAVEQDASGHAMDVALAIALGIGGTKAGAFASSFEEETVIDLFAEQFLWAGIDRLCTLYYDLLVESGCEPETVATELYLSGEMVEVAEAMIEKGFFKQLELHSQTSQYGQLSRGDRVITEKAVEEARHTLAALRSGEFAREWAAEQAEGKPLLARLKEEAFAHPLNEVERRLTGRGSDD